VSSESLFRGVRQVFKVVGDWKGAWEGDVHVNALWVDSALLPLLLVNGAKVGPSLSRWLRGSLPSLQGFRYEIN
jgi:hypothetical protein